MYLFYYSWVTVSPALIKTIQHTENDKLELVSDSTMFNRTNILIVLEIRPKVILVQIVEETINNI